MYVTDGMFEGTGPLACLSPFSVMLWIKSDKGSYLRPSSPMFLMSRNIRYILSFDVNELEQLLDNGTENA